MVKIHSRLKKKDLIEKPVMIWTLDTETRGLFGEIFRIGLYNGTDYYHGYKLDDVYHVFALFEDYEHHVFIHNLDFDLSKMAEELLKDVSFEDSIFIHNNIATFHTGGITFHDSLKLLPSSLKQLSEDFNLGEASKISLEDHLKEHGYKDEKDYFERVDPDEPMLNLYLEHDCTSLYKIIMEVIKISGLDKPTFLKCPTTASLSMRVFRENYPDDYKDATSTNYRGKWGEFIEGFIRLGYYGGRTEVFKPLLLDGFHYDVNSLYPYVMKVNEFPIGHYKFYSGSKAFSYFRAWLDTHIGAGFAEANVFVPDHLNIPPLPKRHMGKLIFPVGNISGVWTFPELELALKYGCKIKDVKQIVYFEKTYPIFKEFVEEFEEIKKTSVGAKRTFAKLVQNALYGKFGMNRKRQTLLDIEKKDELLEKGLVEGEDFFTSFHPVLNKEFIQTEMRANAQYIQPHLAAYVTSYARILLYEGLMNPASGSKSYCDTDSIACQNEFDSDLVHEHEYGKWKLESKIERGVFIQPKLYYEKGLNDKGKMVKTVKAKGIPKDVLKTFGEETYNEILERIAAGEERIELFEKKKVRKKFVTMLKAGEGFDTAQIIKKGINLRAKQKRIMDYAGNQSQPHKVMDF